MAVFSCALMGQYGNNIKTWSKLLEARNGDTMDWERLEEKVLACANLFWGGSIHAVREVRGLQSMWNSAPFGRLVCSIKRGISSFEDYETAFASLVEIHTAVPGCLGIYHRKLAMDHLVASGLLPKRHVSCFPVIPTGDTTQGLRTVYASTTASPEELQRMLLELFTRLRRDRALRSNDWTGSIGAALCWQKHFYDWIGQSRYDYTTDISEVELATLGFLGIAVPGLTDGRAY